MRDQRDTGNDEEAVRHVHARNLASALGHAARLLLHSGVLVLLASSAAVARSADRTSLSTRSSPPASFELVAAAGNQPASRSGPVAPSLKLATWNLEWLIAPATFKPLKATCVPQGQSASADTRRLPCDVAWKLERSSRDFAVLARYARQLDADVISIQEVDGVSAARLVFPDYEFCFTGSHHLQNNGFAVRSGIPKRCGPDATSLSLNDSVRRGAELVLFPGEPRELHLLSVHLKSGCSAKPLNSGDKACTTLARQVPILEAWVDAQAKGGRRFIVLGDFNRALLDEHGPARSARGELLQVWPEIDDGIPKGADLLNPADGQPFGACVPGQGHGQYIDHIVLSDTLRHALIPGSFQRLTYTAADARHARLSDHCPVAIRLAMPQPIQQIPRARPGEPQPLP